MMHSFQFDPAAVLGVAADASLQEIRDAYRQKSKKHHPDLGGDEWAFRVVARAYEVLTTARVVGRASDEFRPPAAAPRAPEPPSKQTGWTSHFRSQRTATPPPTAPGAGTHGAGAAAASNLSGWGGAQPTHAGATTREVAQIVAAELLILRFELNSLDLFARNPEDRNLSCTVHITWPLLEAEDKVHEIPDKARILRALDEAIKAKPVRKHALTRRVEADETHFAAWLTFATAVTASEALDRFREALVPHGLTVEKQVREMAIPRQWG